MLSKINKFQILKQQWDQFSNLCTQQTSERTADIENLVQVIEGKIETSKIFILAQQRVMFEQCEKMGKQIEDVRRDCGTISTEEKENIEYFKGKCQLACQQVVKDINKDKDEIIKTSDDRMKKIRQFTEVQCKASSQECLDQKKQIMGYKVFIEKELKNYQKSQTESLNELHKKVKQQIDQLLLYLQLKKFQKKQKEEKLRLMSETLINQLLKSVGKEQKTGQLTYQCLLKLIEDFYFHMRSNRVSR